MLKIAALLLVSICLANAQQFPLRAIAMLGGGIMNPRTQEPIMIFGDVKFTQASANAPVSVRLNVTFFPPTDILVNQRRGLHIHQFAISDMNPDPSKGCESTGPHFNPTNAPHGSVSSPDGHMGDLSNVVVQPTNGKIFTEIVSNKLSLIGPNSILGRAIVLHENPDDEGRGQTPMSSKNGNAGNRIACGTIGLMNPTVF